MIKALSTLTIVIIFSLTQLHGQSDGLMVEKVSEEICNELQDQDLVEISKKEIDQIFYGTIDRYREIWNKELDKYPNSTDQRARNSFYNQLLNHRLLVTCPKFQSIDYLIDKTLKDDPRRSQYNKVKEFVVALENYADTEVLIAFFDDSLNRDELKIALRELKKEAYKYKLSSSLNIVITTKGYYVSLYDYKSTSGDENLNMTITFSDSSDLLIDQWNYKLKDEIAKDFNLEEFELMDDFGDIMSLPPTAPPLNNPDSVKRKGNKH